MTAKRLFALLTAVLLALGTASALALSEDELPEPVDISRSVEAPGFQMTTIGGGKWLAETFGYQQNLIMVFGRITCYNTRSFLSGIQPAMELLRKYGVTVLVGLFDDPTDEEMTGFREDYPGIECAKVFNDHNNGMWNGLAAWQGATNSVTFPVVFLRDCEMNLRYCSTGYVDAPLTVSAGAIRLAQELGVGGSAALTLPEDLEEISSELFRNDGLISVSVGGHVRSIGDYAFADNPELVWIYIPGTVESISDTAFSGCGDVIILGPAGSAAQEYAEQNGFSFMER